MQSTPSQPPGSQVMAIRAGLTGRLEVQRPSSTFPRAGARVVLQGGPIFLLVSSRPACPSLYGDLAGWPNVLVCPSLRGCLGVGLLVLESGQSQTHPQMWDCDAIKRNVPHKEEESVPWSGSRAGGLLLVCICSHTPAGMAHSQTPWVLVPIPAWGLMSSWLPLLLEHLSLLLEPALLEPPTHAVQPLTSRGDSALRSTSHLECQPPPWCCCLWIKGGF